jgi:hypothetical protein
VKPMRENGTINTMFNVISKGKPVYSTTPHTRLETRYVLMWSIHLYIFTCINSAVFVLWMAEANRPFTMVTDRHLQCLLKTGRPNYYIPSRVTVSRDLRFASAHVRKQLALSLQVCNV